MLIYILKTKNWNICWEFWVFKFLAFICPTDFLFCWWGEELRRNSKQISFKILSLNTFSHMSWPFEMVFKDDILSFLSTTFPKKLWLNHNQIAGSIFSFWIIWQIPLCLFISRLHATGSMWVILLHLLKDRTCVNL